MFWVILETEPTISKLMNDNQLLNIRYDYFTNKEKYRLPKINLIWAQKVQRYSQSLIVNRLNQVAINKNIMSQPLSISNHIRYIPIRKENSPPSSHHKTTINRHILNLNIEGNIKPTSKNMQNKTVDSNFKTFYNSTNISWRVTNAKRWLKSERKVATSERQSIVGTPFNSLDLAENDDGTPILPLMDREHYRYLLKAISGIKRGRQLSEIRYKDTSDAKNTIPISQKLKNRYTIDHLPIQHNPQNKQHHQHQYQSYAPNIVNISPQLKSRRQNRLSSDSKDNSFQKIFKNKRRMLSKYYDEKQDSGGIQVSILGEEELMIHQINWAKHRRNKINH